MGESMVIQIWETLPNTATRIAPRYLRFPLEFLYSCRVVSRKKIGSDHPCHRLTSPRQNGVPALIDAEAKGDGSCRQTRIAHRYLLFPPGILIQLQSRL